MELEVVELTQGMSVMSPAKMKNAQLAFVQIKQQTK